MKDIPKRWIIIATVIGWITHSYGGEIIKDFNFSSSDLKFQSIGEYTWVSFKDCYFTGGAGTPLLPKARQLVLLPQGAKIVKVEVVDFTQEKLDGRYLICPAQPPQTVGTEKGEFVVPDPIIYSSASPYPEELVNIMPEGYMGGYRVAGIVIYPVQYVPGERQLVLTKSIRVKIVYTEGNANFQYSTLKQKAIWEPAIKEMAMNPEAIEIWGPRAMDNFKNIGALPPDEVEYLVITSSELVSKFNSLVDWKTQKGIPAKVVTTQWIYSNYSGRDSCEKIRNFIKDAHTNWGVIWVLMGGDPSNNVVPLRHLKQSEGSTTENGGDIYFSNLDGNWDLNNNNTFGEVVDSVDLYGDIFVGRASVGDTTEVNTFVQKVLKYEQNPVRSYIPKIISGVQFGDCVFTQDSVLSLFPDSFVKVKGIPSSHYEPRDSIARVGYQFWFSMGHGGTTTLGGLELSGAPANGDKVGILTGVSCDVGRLSYEDCIIEKLMNSPTGGTIGCIANYGIACYETEPALKYTESHAYSFFDNLMTHNIYHMGMMFLFCKDKYVDEIFGPDATTWRHCHYSLNLFGDPELPVWTWVPKKLNINCPAIVYSGVPFAVSISDSIGNPVDSAYICCMNNDAYVRGYTNSNGIIGITAVSDDTLLQITVSKHNYLTAETKIKLSTANNVGYSRHQVSGGNGDEDINPGEALDLTIWLKNSSESTVNNVSARLKTISTYMSVVGNDVLSYGNFSPNEEKSASPYQIAVASNAPDGQVVACSLVVQGNLAGKDTS
ncbi:MAG: hypothetical protein HY769_02370, partial [Candidatus Stahlbacteria bacterium]|nr:hypothetical protein [Candidatus Stahlbacteria bacterium]